MRILLIEDEEGVQRFICNGLKEEGFCIDAVECAEDALDLIRINNKYQLIILDLMLPQMSGLEFLSILRRRDTQTPVLILSAKDKLADKKQGFQRECDDYLTKPFHFEELLMRIYALLRRKQPAGSGILQVGQLQLNPESFSVSLDQDPVSITKKEFYLLRYFMSNVGKVLSRTQILNNVWQENYNVSPNVVDVTINSLRKKIHRRGNYPKIVSIYGVGYIFEYNPQ